MKTTYQKIALSGENIGTIINLVVMDDDSFFDPAYSWIPVSTSVPSGIGSNIIIDPIEIITGNEETFEPFQFSAASGGFTVSFVAPNVVIACKSYDLVWLRQELTNLCKNGIDKGTLAIAGRNGILIDEYCILWDDVNLLLSKLETLS